MSTVPNELDEAVKQVDSLCRHSYPDCDCAVCTVLAALARLRAAPTSDSVQQMIDILRGYNPPDRTIAAQRMIATDIHAAADLLESLARRVEELKRDIAIYSEDCLRAERERDKVRAELDTAQSMLASLADTVASATRNNGRSSDGIELGTDLREWIWKLSYDFLEAKAQLHILG